MKRKTLLEIMADGAAPGLDLALTAVEWLPGISTAVNFLKGYDDFRSRVAVAKILRFIDGTADATAEERAQAPDETEDMAEAILMAIDQYDALEKCEVLGVLYASLLRGNVDGPLFRRLAHAINHAFVDDLRDFLQNPKRNMWEVKERSSAFYLSLERAGLTDLSHGLKDIGRGAERIVITPLGNQLREAFWKIRPYKEHEVPESVRKHIGPDGVWRPPAA